jgi:iron complex outermembrane receptor protein
MRAFSVTRRANMSGTAIVAFAALAAVPAFAQEGPNADAEVSAQPDTGTSAGSNGTDGTSASDIIVTGSRISQSGFTAPTPVTVAPVEALQTKTLLADAVGELPSLRNNTGPQSTQNGFSGARSFLNLRNLGSSRTLVLLDGRRFVPANNSGSPDVNLMPNALVSRVEIVTGGASAAYGSDAVAGVINFILDKEYEGLKFNFEKSVSEEGDAPSTFISATGGLSFAEGRGHFLASAEYYDAKGLTFADRKFAQRGIGRISNTLGGPRFLIVDGAKRSDSSDGGLVTSGPLRGLTFGPGNSLPRNFQYGTNVSNTYMVGGEGEPIALGLGVSLVSPLERKSAFARLSFDVTDDLTIYAEGNLAQAFTRYPNGYNVLTGSLGPLVRIDNPFVTPELRDRMVTAGVTSIRLGKRFSDVVFDSVSDTKTKRGVLGADLGLGDWVAKAYFAAGESKLDQAVPGMLNSINFYQAVDAVAGPGGTPICRSTLTNPNDGCVPYNPMGAGVNTQAANDYVFGTETWQETTRQYVGSVEASGPIFALPGGDFTLALGAEWRKDTYSQDSDAIAQALNPVTQTIGGWRSGNPQPLSGKSTVKEAFIEVAAPLLADVPFAEELNLNAAFRITDYSFSGSVNTWKVGATWSPIPDIRFRATRSRDIRAPNLGDLFRSTNNANANLNDPQMGGALVSNVRVFSVGNTDLVPERANTLTFGAVFQPRFIPGLSVSVDAFRIDIEQAIVTLSNQEILNQCAAGATDLCAAQQRDAGGNLVALFAKPYNLASQKLEGIDLEGSYRTGLGSGRLGLRVLGTYISKLEQTAPGAATINRAGDIGQNSQPKWRVTSQATYDIGGLTLFAQARYIGPGKYDVTFVEGVDINDNSIAPKVYVDARVTARLPDTFVKDASVYFAVTDLLNTKAPYVPNVGNAPSGTDLSLYSLLGRTFRVGAAISF